MVGDEWQEATKVLGQQWELAKINPYDGSAIRVRVRTIFPSDCWALVAFASYSSLRALLLSRRALACNLVRSRCAACLWRAHARLRFSCIVDRCIMIADRRRTERTKGWPQVQSADKLLSQPADCIC